VAEEQGQAETQPNVDQVAADVAKGMLQQEEGPAAVAPRDETGKFAKAKPEQEAEATTEETTETTEAESEEAPQPEVRKHKLTVKAEDGSDEELEVEEEELKRGYMKAKDYSAKTAALKRERESVQAEIKKATELRQKELDEKLELAEQTIWHTLAPEIKNTDWNKRAAENPAEWAQKYQRVQAINGQLAAIQAERQKLAQAREEESRSNFKKQAEEAIEHLKSNIPGWNQDLYGKVLKSGVEYYGFKKDEVNAITDHRAIEVLHDAMQYRALKAKPLVDKKVVQVPKVVKPGTTSEKSDQSAEKFKEGMANLRKSGRTEDAVALAKMMLAREAKQK
jgi:hypothetical protein